MRSALPHGLRRRLAGTLAATGLALAGLVAAAAPASAAACSGTSGVTVVVDTGGSISTGCASGDPSSAWKALTAAGFGTTPVQTFPGALCQIDGYPDTSCVRMPPASAYWAFFHAKAGGSWTYSANGVASYDPAPGTVVGFAFGSGGQPGIAPPAPKQTSAPAPTPTKPKATTAAPAPTSKPAATTPGPGRGSASGSTTTAATPGATATATASATPSPTASAGDPASPGAPGSVSTGPSATALAVAPTSSTQDGSSGLGTLLAGGALVALVAGGAGWAAWRRRA